MTKTPQNQPSQALRSPQEARPAQAPQAPEAPAAPSGRDFERALSALRAGRAVIFPTDTVYGLGVAVNHAASPREIYDLKRRVPEKPVAWLVDGPNALERFGAAVPEIAYELARRHWPGALTLVVRTSPAVPEAFAPTGTIGLRMPASDLALALIREAGPLATSSANLSGTPAPRAFSDIDGSLRRQVAFALEGGVPAGGVASAVIDVSGKAPKLLRRGPDDIALPTTAEGSFELEAPKTPRGRSDR